MGYLPAQPQILTKPSELDAASLPDDGAQQKGADLLLCAQQIKYIVFWGGSFPDEPGKTKVLI